MKTSFMHWRIATITLSIVGAALLLALFTYTNRAHAAAYGNVRVNVVVSGGTASASQFKWKITPGSSSGSGDTVVFTRLLGGSYTVSRVSGPSGYGLTWSGDCNAQGQVIVTENVTKNCTATNVYGGNPPSGGGGSTPDPRPRGGTRTPR